MQTVLLTIVGPTRRVDLKLPAEISLEELLPKLLELCGPPHAPEQISSQWRLVISTQHVALPLTRSLLACGIVDGAILLLQDYASFVAQAAQQAQTQAPALPFQPQVLPPSANTGGIGVRWNLPEH